MNKPTFLALLAASVFFCLVAASFATQLFDDDTSHDRAGLKHSDAREMPAKKCLGDLSTFHNQMLKDGYWMQLPGNGGIGFSVFGALPTPLAANTDNIPSGGGFWRARSGNEIRTLIAAANILAQHGQQQACETLLTSVRPIYQTYLADLIQGGMQKSDVTEWRHKQTLASAPVLDSDRIIRPDELVGTDVVDAQSNGLGSVDDVVLNPISGKIAYLMIKQGGVFDPDEKYIPIPWHDFKLNAGAYLLLLNSNRQSMDAAPKLEKDQFFSVHDFDKNRQEVDRYWAGHMLQ